MPAAGAGITGRRARVDLVTGLLAGPFQRLVVGHLTQVSAWLGEGVPAPEDFQERILGDVFSGRACQAERRDAVGDEPGTFSLEKFFESAVAGMGGRHRAYRTHCDVTARPGR